MANNESWGLKLDQELKDKIQEIVKSDFNSSKEFMEHVVALYEVDKMKQGGSILTEQIEEMEMLSKRMYAVLVNANEKVNTAMTDQRANLEKAITRYQNTIDSLQEEVANAKQKLEDVSNANDELVNLNNEYSQRVNQLTESNLTSTALVNEYKEKNMTLAGQLEDMPGLVSKIDELNTTISKLNDDNNSLKAQLNLAEIKCTNLTAEIENTKATDEIALKAAIIEIQQQHQKELEEVQTRYRMEIDQYQEKYKKLLGRLEKPTKKTKNSHAQS